MDDFDTRIGRLDRALFSHIDSETTDNDRRSLLALQLALREAKPQYRWLEIGSHLGGSLQAIVADARCAQIVSIDSRPPSQPDERGAPFRYDGNSTARMLELLRAVPGARVDRLQIFDVGTDTLRPAQIPAPPDLCFVDGEHTDAAVVRDARFCLSAVATDGCIAFHDSHIIYRGLARFARELGEARRTFHAYNLPDSIMVFELGASALSDSPPLREMLANGHAGYLWSLMANDEYRQAYHRPSARLARWAAATLHRLARQRWNTRKLS